MEDFVGLHNHSDASQLDGAGKISEYIKAVVERKAPSIAFTEHGTMRGYQTQYDQCKEHNIKPIYGIEFYVANDMRRKGLTEDERADITKGKPRSEHKDAIKKYEEQHGIRDRWHLTCWAKNAEGMRNMMRLASLAYTEGFYYKPRIDLNELYKYKEGLVVATGCCSSVIYDRAVLGKKKLALEIADEMREQFGEDLWIEIQPHAIEEQVISNQLALELKDRWGKKARLLATQDAHYVRPEDWETHEVMLCIGTNDVMSNPERFRFTGNDFHFKTRKEMFAKFRSTHAYLTREQVKESLDNTLVFMDTISDGLVTIDKDKCLMPPIPVPEKYDGNEFAYLKDLCLRGWAWRDIPARATLLSKREGGDEAEWLKRYVARLKRELTAIKSQKFVSYFLLVHDLYNWVRQQEIMCGPGRGSAAGSLVAYLTGITSVDPIEHNLLFERFISPTRVDQPDIDMDFEDRRRQEIIEYLRNKYGNDKVCQIATVGKLSGKAVIRDISRVLEVPYAAVNQVTNSIIERSSGDERASQTVEDSFKEFKVCREFNAKYPDVLRYAKKLEGMAKTLGIHAAGVVTSPEPLMNLVPLETRKHDGRDVVVSAIDMYGVAACGLLKLDVLGLRTLSVIRECLEAVEQHTGEKIDLERIDLNLKDVLQGFTDHDYCGVFQYDSPGADKICTGVEFKHFEDIAAMTALNRPGTARSGLATQYVARKRNPKLVEKASFHPAVSEITKDTLGIIVYQEHVMRIFTDIAGFAPATADSLRKKIAKKFGDETIGKERENFIKGAMENWGDRGMTKEIAGKIMDAITFFGCIPGESLVLVVEGSDEDLCALREESVGKGIVLNTLPEGIQEGKNGDRESCEFRAQQDRGAWARVEVSAWGEGHCVEQVAIQEDNRGIKSVLEGRTHQKLQTSKEQVVEGREGMLSLRHFVDQGIRAESKVISHPPQESKQSGQPRRELGSAVSKLPQQRTHERKNCWATWKEIETLKVGDWIVSFDDDIRPELNRVKRIECTGVKPVRRMTLEQGEIWATGSHWWMNSTGEYIETKDCTPGTELRVGDSIFKVLGNRKDGRLKTWDLECEFEPSNYAVRLFNSDSCNYLISHNSYGFNKSHATEFDRVAYWEMFLKIRHPIEFYWALLKNEPDRIRIQQIAKDAKKHGIELLPPSVVNSGKHFTIDRANNAIRGSLVDIKGVGDAASESIMVAQPYKDFGDLIQRVDRRKVHKGVIVALAKAGALDDVVPNPKWLIENIEDFWTELGKKGWTEKTERLLRDSADAPQFTTEERQVVASKVSPLAFGKHPLDAYANFMERSVKVPIAAMSDEDFFKDNDNQGVFIAGVVVEVKYNQIGDFNTGELPSELERKQMFWGRRYANVNVEDLGGKQNRIKVDFDIFDDYRDVVDSGIGTPVVLHAFVNARFENLRCHFMINLEEYRLAVEAGQELTVWQSIVAGRHPAKEYEWKDPSKLIKYKTPEGEEREVKRRSNAIRNKAFWDRVSPSFVGVVTHVRPKYDKNGNRMAFLGLLDGGSRFISVIAFASSWTKEVRRVLKPGALVKIELDSKRDKRSWSYFYNGGKLRVLRSAPSTTSP